MDYTTWDNHMLLATLISEERAAVWAMTQHTYASTAEIATKYNLVQQEHERKANDLKAEVMRRMQLPKC